MVAVTLSRVGRVVLDLLYPPRCSLCGRAGAFVCEACLAKLPRALPPRCARCWLPVLAGAPCGRCRVQPLRLTAIRSPFRYEGDVRRLVQAFKFGGQSALAEAMAGQIVSLVRETGLDAEVIVPVPLSTGRQRQRGYNQAGLLAAAIGKSLELPVALALRRTRSGQAQARSASAAERLRNVEGAFAVTGQGAIAGRRVMVVDDVATTGATLDACARALLKGGAAAVEAVTFARED